MEEKENEALEATVALFVGCFLLVPSSLFRAWVFFLNWNWFGPAIGLPTLTFPIAAGLSVLIGLILFPLITDKSEKNLGPLGNVILGFIKSTFISVVFLTAGAAFHWWAGS